jgi:hypothetical protein
MSINIYTTDLERQTAISNIVVHNLNRLAALGQMIMSPNLSRLIKSVSQKKIQLINDPEAENATWASGSEMTVFCYSKELEESEEPVVIKTAEGVMEFGLDVLSTRINLDDLEKDKEKYLSAMGFNFARFNVNKIPSIACLMLNLNDDEIGEHFHIEALSSNKATVAFLASLDRDPEGKITSNSYLNEAKEKYPMSNFWYGFILGAFYTRGYIDEIGDASPEFEEKIEIAIKNKNYQVDLEVM